MARGHRPLNAGGVGQKRKAVHIPHRVDMGPRGLQIGVHRDTPAVDDGRRRSSPSPLRQGPTSHTHQHLFGGQNLPLESVRRHPFPFFSAFSTVRSVKIFIPRFSKLFWSRRDTAASSPGRFAAFFRRRSPRIPPPEKGKRIQAHGPAAHDHQRTLGIRLHPQNPVAVQNGIGETSKGGGKKGRDPVAITAASNGRVLVPVQAREREGPVRGKSGGCPAPPEPAIGSISGPTLFGKGQRRTAFFSEVFPSSSR
jgi:hypothetical protein